jgi:hypothetical protein
MSVWKYESRGYAVIVAAQQTSSLLSFGHELMRQERLMSEKDG